MQNRPSPDLKSVVERDMAGETVFGIRVAAWRSPIKKPADCPQEKWDGVFPHGAGHTYAEHWSTEGPGAERLFTEADVRSLLLTQKDRLDKLEEALRPFAEVADWYDASEDDSFEVWQDYPHGLDRSRWSKLANFRKARAALTGSHT